MAIDHGGNVEQAAREYNLQPEEIIDFSANINFLGPPESVKQAIKENVAAIKNYPDPHYYQLKTALAEQLPVRKENLLLGNGAVELIYLLVNLLQPEKALVLAPTFSEYGRAVKSINGEVEEYYLDREREFELEVDNLLPELAEVDLFFLCNPNNPTGKYLRRSEVKRVIDEAAYQDTPVVVDEAFVDLMEEDISIIEQVKKYDNLFVLRSLTKFFAIPGLRLGYGVGTQELVSQLRQNKDPWNVNYFAQLAGQAAIDDQEYIRQTKESITEAKEFLYRKLQEFPGFKVYYPAANYVFVDISEAGLNSDQLEEKLARQGILIRNCSTYSGLKKDFIRLAVKSPSEIEQLIGELERILRSYTL